MQVLRYIDYSCRAGDTWDSLAIAAYNEERLSSLVIDHNRDYIDTLIFEGGEKIKIPVINADDLETADSLPPWRTE